MKFDNLRPLCYNTRHDHLPGVYSTEAIGNAMIQTYRDFDAENRDVLLMLYWGYQSPWWLLHADTLFESGLGMEASFPASFPTLYTRDSVTQGLDQGEWYGSDIPRLGKDSLGVWLSDWSWMRDGNHDGCIQPYGTPICNCLEEECNKHHSRINTVHDGCSQRKGNPE